jgi:hypothetical protein
MSTLMLCIVIHVDLYVGSNVSETHTASIFRTTYMQCNDCAVLECIKFPVTFAYITFNFNCFSLLICN